MTPAARPSRRTLVLLLALVGGGTPAGGQSPDSIGVVAGPRYTASPLHERLLGRGYRDVWTTPARFPVLDLATFAGGLTPVERGGGQQTRALRFVATDGTEYNFRSVDKWVSPDPREDLEGTPVEALVQDQVSSLHPAAAIVATGLLDAVGVPNPGPRMMVMPDDPRLGEFREEFAGMLGTIEVHADEPEDGGPGFGGAAEVESEEDFFAALRESADNRVDAETLLTERLLSLLMADWDRHEGQYRWARFDSAGLNWWVPVPEDRDYAFADYDALLFKAAGSLFPKGAPFRAAYRADLTGLTLNSAQLDRRLLVGLSWDAWRESVARIQGALTDEAIAAAVRLMPPEYLRLGGPELIRILRLRRDGLPDVASRFYLQLASDPEIHATDVAERAEVVRSPDGSVRVTIAPVEGVAAEPYFDRTFLAAETRELRIHLHGGDDDVVVRGVAKRSPLVRVIGGAGADTLRDESSVGGPGPRTAFHDAEGEDSFEPGGEAVVDRSPYQEPVWVPGEILPPRDWGSQSSWFDPWVDYEGTEGVIIGGGPSWTWYGFRRLPYAARASVKGLYGTRSGRAGVDAVVESRGVGHAPDLWLHGRLSALEAYRFHGFGNESPAGVEDAIVRYGQRLVEARIGYRPLPGLTFSIGPRFEALNSTRDEPEVPATRDHTTAGVAASLELETRPDRTPLRGGFRLTADGALHPPTGDLNAPLGRLAAEAVGYMPVSSRLLLATRIGGAQLWGEHLLPQGALLGGSANLRGYPYQRFTGDAMAYGNLEARAMVTRAQILVRGDLGVLAFTDAGRVFVDGSSEGGWHTAYGFGLWFASMSTAVSATYAHGDGHRLYLKLGLPF